VIDKSGDKGNLSDGTNEAEICITDASTGSEATNEHVGLAVNADDGLAVGSSHVMFGTSPVVDQYRLQNAISCP
jgi:hypothetical protein